MATNENLIPIPGRLHSVATEGHVAGADEIFDDSLNKDQATINQEVSEAIGTGGSVDSRIAAAINALDASVSKSAGADGLALSVTEENGKVTAINGSIASNTYDSYGSASAAQSAAISAAATDATTKVNAAKAEIKGNATSACDTLGEAEALIAAEATRAGAAEVALDTAKADKDTTLAGYGITDAYTKSETYTKTEVNGLVDTPHQEYETVDAYSNLPETGSKDTIYRVSNYNGSTSQVDTTSYSEYAWDGSQYIFLCVKSQIGEVFDISVYNNNTKYADLAAALNGGANIPQSLQKGGMSVKFVQSYDNKYVQYRLMANTFSTNESDWQGVDDEPKAGSENLVKSGGVASAISMKVSKNNDIETSLKDDSACLYITDEKGYTIAKFDEEGIHANMIKDTSHKFIVSDNSGNIAFLIKSNGETDMSMCAESFLRGLDKAESFNDDFDVDAPSSLYRVTNDIYSEREYAPCLFAERMQEDAKELTFDRCAHEWYLARKESTMFSGLYKSDVVTNQVSLNAVRKKDLSLNLITTKSSVFYAKKLNFMPIGDSITAQANWHTYIRKLLLMDNIDWQIANNSDTVKFDMQTLGIIPNNSNTSFTYREHDVNIGKNYSEGRSSWSAATYLRHAELYTFESIVYNGSSKSILHVAWRVLGLYEKEGIEYSGTLQQKEYIRTTCNGQYAITTGCIDGWVWNKYRSNIGASSVEFSNATPSQKEDMITYLTVTLLDNPSNPFFSKEKVNETKNTDECYAFDWSTYYSRYKTHDENGNELDIKGSKATSSMHVCIPNVVGICLGTNDSVWQSSDTTENMQDAYKIASLIQSATDAAVIIFANGRPQTSFISNYKLAGSQHENNKYYQTKNKQLREICGDFTNQIAKNIFYCPCFYVQSFGTAFDRPLVELYTEKVIGSVLTVGDIHPSHEATSRWSYQIYSLMAYLITQNII